MIKETVTTFVNLNFDTLSLDVPTARLFGSLFSDRK